MTQRFLLALCFATALAAAPMESVAQDGPTAGCEELFSKMRLQGVVPNAPGGGRDTLMRLIVRQLEQDHAFASTTVVNLAGGRAIPAMLAVANPRDGEVAIGIFNLREVILPSIDGQPRPEPQDFELLATPVREPSVWLTRPDFDLTKQAGRRLVLGASSFSPSEVFDFLIPASILGTKPEAISSYGGSSEQTAALLRGDVDVVTVRLSTASNALKSGDLKVALVLTDGPAPAAPDYPYLAGTGGLLQQVSPNASPAERDRLEALALATARLSPTVVSLLVSSRLDKATQDCVGAAVDSVVLSEAFAQEAKGLKQFVAPLEAAQTAILVKQMLKDYKLMESDIAEALAPFLSAK
jgi:hypothetical protein